MGAASGGSAFDPASPDTATADTALPNIEEMPRASTAGRRNRCLSPTVAHAADAGRFASRDLQVSFARELSRSELLRVVRLPIPVRSQPPGAGHYADQLIVAGIVTEWCDLTP